MSENSQAVAAPVEPSVMQHTRGPWRYELAPSGGFDIEKDPNDLGRYMVIATRNSYPARAAEMHANALLITAAPLMAAALDCIVRRLQMDVDGGDRPDQWTMEDLIRTAKAALPAGWVIGAA